MKIDMKEKTKNQIDLSQRYMAAPDILRVACVFIVAWYHIWQQSWLDPSIHIGKIYINLWDVISDGYMMVDVMLLLSGFLLALPCARRQMAGLPQQSPENFYRRRFWRIGPSYLLANVTVFLFYSILEGKYGSWVSALKDLQTHLTFTHTFFYDTYIATPSLVVIWTLAVEVQFYALWPMCALYYRKHPGWVCAVMTVIAFSYRAWVYPQPDTNMLVNQLPGMLDIYACGLGSAWVLARLEMAEKPGPAVRRWLAPLGMVVGFAVLVRVMYVQGGEDYEALRKGQLLWRPVLGLAGGVFLVCGCLAPQKMSELLGNRVTRFLSAVSFNFYMWHQFLACRLRDWHIVPSVSDTPNQVHEHPWQMKYTLLCFFTALVVSTAITYLWERPLAQWARKREKYVKKSS